jgi:hypothetical protein
MVVMLGEQQKITRVCTIKMSLFTIKSSWSCSHVADESRHTDGKYMPILGEAFHEILFKLNLLIPPELVDPVSITSGR